MIKAVQRHQRQRGNLVQFLLTINYMQPNPDSNNICTLFSMTSRWFHRHYQICICNQNKIQLRPIHYFDKINRLQNSPSDTNLICSAEYDTM